MITIKYAQKYVYFFKKKNKIKIFQEKKIKIKIIKNKNKNEAIYLVIFNTNNKYTNNQSCLPNKNL